LWGVQRETDGLVYRKVLASKGAVIIGRQNLIQTKAQSTKPRKLPVKTCSVPAACGSRRRPR
jgi:hypothetical protein